MGEVYLAHDHVLDRLVAIKFVGHHDPAARDRFRVEARAVARIHHPNVMTLFRIGELDGHPYFVSEYVRGKSLAELPLPIPWLRALELAVGLARGLAAAHRQGVLHRDIKPANVLLDEEGVVKLLDFSLAKLVDGSIAADRELARPHTGATADHEATDAGTLLGTPNFMAPELWRAEPATRGSDVYALGVLVYMLCLGRPPNDGTSSFDLGEHVQTHEPPPLAGRVLDIDPQFAAILDRCIRRSPDERYASGEELRAALEALAPAAHAAAARRGNPYRGLRAFEAEHEEMFCGRFSETQAILARLRKHPLVIVAGDPGVGKSSLARAGVLPAIRNGRLDPTRTWTAAMLVPSLYPNDAIVAALACGLDLASSVMAASLADDADRFIEEIRRDLGETRGIVLLVDPLEELISLAGPYTAAAVIRLLARLATDVRGVRVMIVARSDYQARLSRLPGPPAPLPQPLLLLAPGSSAAREAVVGPARTRGVRFESDVFVDRLAALADDNLPLLQLVLAELWEARDIGGAVVTTNTLERIGGVSSVLARHADRVLSGLTVQQQRTARVMLMRLVSVDGTRAALSAEDLLIDARSQVILETMLASRLLALRIVDGDAVYEIAHDSLLRGWLTLRAWLDGDREARSIRHGLATDAAEWQRLARPNQALWREPQISASFVDPSALHPRELAFLTASRASARRRRNTRRLAGIVAALVALVLSFGLLVQRERTCVGDPPRATDDAGIAAVTGQRG